MLCIFSGPTKTIEPAVVVNGVTVKKVVRRIAGECQSEIESQVCKCEHSPAICERKEGCFELNLKKETIKEATERIRLEHQRKHLPFDANSVIELDCQTSTVGEKCIAKTPDRIVLVSPALKKDNGMPVTINDFPDSFSFGNGVTCNSTVTFKDGSKRIISWCAFPDNMEWTVRAGYNKLRKIFEA